MRQPWSATAAGAGFPALRPFALSSMLGDAAATVLLHEIEKIDICLRKTETRFTLALFDAAERKPNVQPRRKPASGPPRPVGRGAKRGPPQEGREGSADHQSAQRRR